MEEWRAVPGRPEYEVSSEGRVRGIARRLSDGKSWPAKVLTLNQTDTGYLRVMLYRAGKWAIRKVHRLVLEAFVGPRPEGMECRHLDGDRTRNQLSNLCWGTRSDNRKDQERHGTGIGARAAKLNAFKVRCMRALIAQGARDVMLARAFKVSPRTVFAVRTRERWAEVA
jgi:hypothetical protein